LPDSASEWIIALFFPIAAIAFYVLRHYLLASIDSKFVTKEQERSIEASKELALLSSKLNEEVKSRISSQAAVLRGEVERDLTRFSYLADKRLEVATALFTKLKQAHREIAQLTSAFQRYRGEERIEFVDKIDDAMTKQQFEDLRTTAKAVNELIFYFDEHRFFFAEHICERFDDAVMAFKMAAHNVETALRWEGQNWDGSAESSRNLRKEAEELGTQKLPDIAKLIEDDFRALIGASDMPAIRPPQHEHQ